MKTLISFLLFLVCFCSARAQQTYNITGVVTDEKDQPIPGATVFIADSRKATVSDAEGKFTLWQVQPGKYNLIVKMIGYAVITHEFLLRNSSARFRFKLAEDNIMLKTVEISAMSWAERKGYLAIFIRNFLGGSNNAAQCRILNTDDIQLRYNKKTNVLTASSNEFLIIENRALGYRMKYLLNNFMLDRSLTGNGFIAFDGTLFFEDMKGSARQQKKWEEERANTYMGSIPHYFRSLFSNTLEENGFLTYILPNPKAMDNMMKKKYGPEMLAKYTHPVGASFKKYIGDIDDDFKILKVDLLKKDSVEMLTLYTPKREPQDFIQRGNVIQRVLKMPVGQLSMVQPWGDSLLVSRRGDISPVTSILISGFWAWGQVSSFLPSDYELPAGTKIPNANKFVSPAGTISVRKEEQ